MKAAMQRVLLLGNRHLSVFCPRLTTASRHGHIAMILRDLDCMKHDRTTIVHCRYRVSMSMGHDRAHDRHPTTAGTILALRCCGHHTWRLRSIPSRGIRHHLSRIGRWNRPHHIAVTLRRRSWHGRPHRLAIQWRMSIHLHPTWNWTRSHWMPIHYRARRVTHHRRWVGYICGSHVVLGCW